MIDHPRFAPYAELFDAFEAAGHELRFVGGCVRDLVMGAADIGDIDLATSATPPEIKDTLAEHGFKVIPLGERFGTISTLVRGVDVEITTYRIGEVYEPGSRHPNVVFGTDIRLDLGRRDLSINAMAMDRDGAIIDPYGGRDAIERGLLEVPGGGYENTISILRDDPLRLLRIARFAARFAFPPTPETTRAAAVSAPDLQHISHERWLAEWDKLLIAARPDVGLRWLTEVHAIGEVFPAARELAPATLEAVAVRMLHAAPTHAEAGAEALAAFDWGARAPRGTDALRALRWCLWLATLADGAVDGLGPSSARRDLSRATAADLRLSNARRDRWEALLTAPAPALGGDTPSLRREVDALQELVFLHLDLARERGADASAIARHAEALTTLLAHEDPVPRLPRGLGAKLRKGFRLEGPAIGAAMRAVRELVFDGVVPNGADADAYVAAYAEASAATNAGPAANSKSTRAASEGGADRDGR